MANLKNSGSAICNSVLPYHQALTGSETMQRVDRIPFGIVELALICLNLKDFVRGFKKLGHHNIMVSQSFTRLLN